MKSLTLSRSFGQERGDKLCELLAATFRALGLISVVFFYAENDGKLLITFETSILIAGHSFPLLSPFFLNEFVSNPPISI